MGEISSARNMPVLFFLSWEGRDTKSGCPHRYKGNGCGLGSTRRKLGRKKVGHTCSIKAPRRYLTSHCRKLERYVIEGEGLFVLGIGLTYNLEVYRQILLIHHQTVVPVALRARVMRPRPPANESRPEQIPGHGCHAPRTPHRFSGRGSMGRSQR